jgi:hypothetical protein
LWPCPGLFEPADHVNHQSELHAMFAISISGKRNNFVKQGLAGGCGHSGPRALNLPHFP